MNAAESKSDRPRDRRSPRSAYVHIPFCRRRCFYCDFPISVLGDHLRGEVSGTVADYVDWLCREIALTPRPKAAMDTVFFGGGTPSLLAVSQLDKILTTLERHLGISAEAEISMEIDPGTFDWDHLQSYRQLGINRVSLGVQAFNDESLAACGRTHRVADIEQSIRWLHQIAMPTWSLDLISGLPHQTLGDWRAGLARAIAHQPPHISIYDLTVEPQTVFAQRYHPGESPLPSDQHTADMYRLAQACLTDHGYEHYEVSNYAQPGHQCRHNRTYWENRPCYGFGMGAASYVDHQRFSRPRTRREYQQWVEHLEQQGLAPTVPDSALEQIQDRLMVGLRLAEGVDLSDCSEAVWQRLLQGLQPYLKKGWVITETAPPQVRVRNEQVVPTRRLRLSDPEGFLFSNQVLVDLFHIFNDPVLNPDAINHSP
ncbi:coproporphyrinogen III oxidase [filamentous cyanobacterium CCP5]|nr:coproporphyrinogen III oxidase [filamentous cyanobacterium CCP5]